MKLFVYKTVKWKVINVEFLRRDPPLNKSAIMVKWKCLKLLYSSKGMCRIDNQLKKLIRLKYLILERLYTFSLYPVDILVLHTPNTPSPIFSGIKNKQLSYFGFSNLSFSGFSNLLFLVFVFTTLKKKIFIFKYF